MTTRVIRTEADIEALRLLVKARKLPLTVEITAGESKTNQQNRLQRQWCNDVAAQLGDRTAEDVRAYSKLHFGVPILRAESEAYCAKYDAYIRPLPYETKLAYMAVPFDFAVTRAMTICRAAVGPIASCSVSARAMMSSPTLPPSIRCGSAANFGAALPQMPMLSSPAKTALSRGIW